MGVREIGKILKDNTEDGCNLDEWEILNLSKGYNMFSFVRAKFLIFLVFLFDVVLAHNITVGSRVGQLTLYKVPNLLSSCLQECSRHYKNEPTIKGSVVRLLMMFLFRDRMYKIITMQII